MLLFGEQFALFKLSADLFPTRLYQQTFNLDTLSNGRADKTFRT